MNRDDIIRMAREADREWDCDRDMVEWLEHFANLVVEAEREACAQLCDHWPYGRDDLWSQGQAIRARGKK